MRIIILDDDDDDDDDNTLQSWEVEAEEELKLKVQLAEISR